jgi:acetyltransferase-like isoleucine patch superfamily enzyme
VTVKALLWKLLLDPLVRKIESRLAHFQNERSSMHDGQVWREHASIGNNVVFYPGALLTNPGPAENLRIGDFCHVRGEILVTGPGQFQMGHHSFIGPGSRVWCAQRVSIGSHVLVSHLVDIHDSNSHALDWETRRDEAVSLFEHGQRSDGKGVLSAEVRIEDHVWIGFKSSILRGVTIGEGAVVASGSIVTKDVPPYALVAGSPARVIRDLRKDAGDGQVEA